MLQPDKAKQLDRNIKQMLENGASNEDIMAYSKDYVKMFGEKKKDNSISSSPQPKSESVPQNGSSAITGSLKPGENISTFSKTKTTKETTVEPSASKYPEGSMAWNVDKLSKSKNWIALDNDLKKATTISDEKKNEIVKEVEDEANGVGIWNTINRKGKEFYNSISENLGPLSRLVGVGNKVETDPLAEEKKQAVKVLTQKGYKPSDINNELVKKTAIDLKVNKRLNSEKESLMRDYSSNLSENEKYTHKLKEGVKVAGTQQQKNILENQVNIKDGVLLTRKNNLDNINKEILEYQKRGEQVPDSVINKQKEELSNFQNSIKESISAREEFLDKDSELKDAQSNLDYFKRDYSKLNNILTNIATTTGDLIAGGVEAVDYALNVKQSVLGQNATDTSLQEGTKIVSNLLKDVNQELRGEIAKPLQVDDIHSMNDFGRWMGYSVMSSQIPIFATIATGAPGIAAMGASATGNKYDEMTQEEGVNYSDTELALKPIGYGVTETASAIVDRIVLGNASKILKAATEPERQMISKGMSSYFLDAAKDVSKNAIMEGVDEGLTQGFQNLIDGKPFMENMKDPVAAGAIMGAILPISSHVVSQAIKPFNTDNKIQKISSDINSLKSLIENTSDQSKDIILNQIKDKENNIKQLLEKKVNDIKSLSNEDFNEVIKIEQDQQKIKDKVSVIKSDTSISDEMSDKIISNLKEEFDTNEARRKELLAPKPTEEVTDKNKPVITEAKNVSTEPTSVLSEKEGELPSNNTESQQEVSNIEGNSPQIDEETETKVVEKAKIKAKNFRDLYNVNREIFGQDKMKSLASTVVMDRIVGQMANRANVSKSDIYDTLEFTKTDENEIQNLSEKGKVLYQIAGKNAKLSSDIKDGLSQARKMDKSGSDPKAIRALTGWEKGADGKWGYEFDDSKVSLKGEIGRKPLSEFINHEELFKFYPEFKDIDVIPKYDLDSTGLAHVNKNRIFINPDELKNDKETVSTILHEVQHFIQDKEDFARGGSESTIRQAIEEQIANNGENSNAFSRIKRKLFGENKRISFTEGSKSIKSLLNEDDFKLYESLVGEVQARNVETRMNMTPEERKNTLLKETEDVNREEQIILFQNNKGAAQIAEDGKAVIHAITNPDVSTPLHELAHVYEKYLTDEEKNHVLQSSNTNEWTTETSEYFARGFEKYLADGVAPDSVLQKIFDKFKEWLTDIYNGIKDSEIDIELNSEMKRIYAQMIGVESGTSNNSNILKVSENGKSYSTTFKNGILEFKDENGNEPSAPTKRKLQDKWAENFDFTQGKTTFEIPAGGINISSYEDYVVEHSENPAEVAEALLNMQNIDALEGIDYKTKIIAENIGSKSIERQSFVDNSDINNVNQSIALQYFAKKGEGRSLDTLAQELSEQANIEVTEQDIIDFMLDNPSGVESFINRTKKDKLEPLENKFSDLTGLPASQKFLEKAIDQQIQKDQWLKDYATELDFLSDENLLSLLQEYNEYGTTEKTNQSDIGSTQSSSNENSEVSKEQSRVQAESGPDDTGVTDKPKSGVEFDNSDLEDDTELKQQGFFSSNNQNLRDLLLSENGPVKVRFPFQKHFKRVFSQTFIANAGLDIQTGEVVRSRNRTLSAFTDHLEYESNEFNKIIRGVKKSNPKKINDSLLAINDYLSGDKNADISFLNNEQKEKLDYFRERINSLSRSIIDNLNSKISGLQEKSEKYEDGSIGKRSIDAAVERTQNLIDTIESNMDKYINRSYQIFSDDEYRDNITGDFDKLNKEGQLRIRNAINYLIREDGMNKEDATKAVAEYLSEIRRSKSDFPFSSTGNASAPFLKKRKDIPKEFRELLGESKDPLYNYINTVYKLSQYVANVEYQSKLREHLLNNNIGKLEPELGYVKLTSNDDGWRILNDIYVPVDFKEAMDDMQPLKTIESGFYKAWIKIAGITKINKTILSPTTTARNLISGVFLGVNAGHFFLSNPKAMAVAWNNAWTTKKSQKELFSERQKLLKLGVLGDGSNSGELLAILNDFSKEVDRMVNKNAFVQFFDIAKKAYAFGDDFYKVTGFYIEKNRLMQYGMSETEAEEKSAFRINNGYPTYSYLPKNMQRLRRLPLVGTFVSFPYESIRSTKNNFLIAKEDLEEGRTKLAFQRLAGMLVANATLNGLSALTLSFVGLTDDDDDAIRDMLPEWQRNSKLIYLGTKNGKPIFIDGTALFPSETIFKPISTLIEERDGRKAEDNLQEALNELLSPYISKDITFKTIMEVSENKNQFGQKIYQSDNIVDGVLSEGDKIINYLMKQVGPGVYNNITEFMKANEIAPEYVGDKFSSYGKESTNQEALLGLLGLRISTINYNSAMSSFAYQVKETEQSDKGSASKLVKTSKILSDKDVESIVNDYGKYHKQNFDKMLNIVNSGKKMGMSDDDIRSSLKVSKMSNSDIKSLLKGEIPELKPLSTQSINNYKEKLTINYKGENISEVKKNFDKNVKLLEKAIKKYNKEKKSPN